MVMTDQNSPGSAPRGAAGLAGLLWVPPGPSLPSWHGPSPSWPVPQSPGLLCCAALPAQDQSVIVRPKVRPVCLELSGEQSPE